MDAKQEIQHLLGDINLDVFIDNTGLPTIIELGYELIHRQGRLVLVGVRSGNTVNLFHCHCILQTTQALMVVNAFRNTIYPLLTSATKWIAQAGAIGHGPLSS